jgi:antitoxin HicB
MPRNWRIAMFTYPVELTADEDGGFVVTFTDMPYGVTEGDDEDEALMNAVGALETVVISLMDDKQDIPPSSRPKRGQKTVTLPALSAAKVALYQTMRAQGVRKAELARRLGLHMPQIDRLLDLRHSSRFDQIDMALRALGKSLTIEIMDAA